MEELDLIQSMKNSSKYLLALTMVVLVTACGTDGNTGANGVEDGSSQFVGATVLKDMNDSYMLNVLKAVDINATNAFGYENAFGYKSVKITYNTVGQDDKPVVASGLLVIPTISEKYKASLASIGKSYSVSMICDNHGTIFTNAEAPTNVEQTTFYPLAVSMSAYAGFAGIYPDYIGYGDSNDVTHPYILKKASARSAVDMIKASIKYMEENGVILNHQLYISGYSEGGYNAMALAQSVENGTIQTVNLMGVAPMAGPYNVEDMANIELNASKRMVIPAFLADLGYSYSHYYSDVNLSDIAVPSLGEFQLAFNGSNDTVPIHIILGLGAVDANGTVTDYGFYTHTTNELFKDSFISDYQNNQNNVMRQKFVENNLDNWTPKSKMNFIQCVNDEIIPFSESNNTYNKFKANGADVTLTPLTAETNTTDIFAHVNCGPAAYTQAVGWFDAIRQGIIK